MKTTEIRVRPVVRHIVTSFTNDPETRIASCGQVGEFDNEQKAEEVAQALKDKYAPRCYVIVEETLGELSARVMYAYSEEEVATRKAAIEAETGKSFKVYSRIREQMLYD